MGISELINESNEISTRVKSIRTILQYNNKLTYEERQELIKEKSDLEERQSEIARLLR